jgi:hypothetical protein
MPRQGEFVLYSRVLPPLPADAYTFHVEETVEAPGAPGAHIDPLDVHVEITAPRFILPPDEILSTYPPNEATGAFSSRLPQIVLRRRTLPWERQIFPFRPAVPWLALILLEDGEGELKTGVPLAECVTPGYTLPPLHDDAQVGNCVTVSTRVARGVLPNFDDMERLAHVRVVDLTDTELALGDDDGSLAVVVANRLPLPGKRYTAYLISIEGQWSQTHFMISYADADTATTGFPDNPVEPYWTYPVLAHWSFTCAGEGDFQSLMQELDVGVLDTLATPKPPSGAKPPPPPRRPEPPEVLDTGHVALDHVTRDGERGRVWYRGPCVPHPGTRQQPDADGRLPLLHTSDQARRIGPDGRENLSLAGAFEIGRLLALAEPNVVAALLLWRRAGFTQARAAALLNADPVLSALETLDVGRGFAARATLDALASLGDDHARRLGPVRPLVQPGVPIPELDDADALAVVAAGFGVDRELLDAVVCPPEPTFATAGQPLRQAFDALVAQADAALADLRTAAGGASSDGPEGGDR